MVVDKGCLSRGHGQSSRRLNKESRQTGFACSLCSTNQGGVDRGIAE